MNSDASSSASVQTIQLRRYQIEPGRMAEHVAWFPKMRAAREEYGYKVLFAYADEENSVFTWAVAMDGDREAFAAFDAAWADSPERAVPFSVNPMAVTSLEVAIVTDVLAG